MSVTHIDTPEASLWTVDDFLSRELADRLYATFSAPEFPLVTEPVVVLHGSERRCQRRVGFFSDVSRGYRFAGQTALAHAHTPETRDLLDEINWGVDADFNGLLINDYRRDRPDYIGSHPDSIRDLSRGMVAMITLYSPPCDGVEPTERPLRIRTMTGSRVVDVPTRHGQLLVMDGEEFQRRYKHEVPRWRVRGGRVSITARAHVQ